MENEIKTGINYVGHIDKELIKYLIRTGIIGVLKFPGLSCTPKDQDQFIEAFKELKKSGLLIEADIHGFTNFKPHILNSDITPKTWDEVIRLFKETGAKHFSTHINVKGNASLTKLDSERK